MEIYLKEKKKFVPITDVKELDEWCDYEVKFQDPPKLHRKIFSAFKSGSCGIINFQNFVGFTKIEGHQILVKSKKFDNNEFNAMLSDIKNQIANLSFYFDSPTYLPYKKVPEPAPDILYHDFAYLRYIICQTDERDCLESQIRKILYDPHRKLEKEVNYFDVDRIHTIDNKTLYNIISETKNLTKLLANSQLISTTLGKNLTTGRHTHYPSRVYANTIVSSFDTPENRFIKYFLKQCESIVKAFKDYIHSYSSEVFYLMDCNLNRDLEFILNFLRTIQVDTIFSEVEDITFIPIGSSILQKKEGYREILEFYSLLNMRASYNTLEVNLQRIIQNKDIATLYEYWCFFKVKEILEDLIGKCRKTIGTTFNELYSYIEWELCLEFSNDCKLYYNKAFRKESESYSVTLRPDIALEIGNDIYLFDAKFRMDKLPQIEAFENDVEETPDSTFKKSDLYKMHTYKDAIKTAKSVFILYPGEEEIFYPKYRGVIKQQFGGLERVILDLNSSKNFADGVGVLSLNPSKLK